MTALQMELDFKSVKQKFFDRRGIARKISKENRVAMTKVGGFIRTTAKRSMRRPTKTLRVSQPGKPPRRHKGYLAKGIFFAYDEQKMGVIVGPVKFSGNANNVLEPQSRKRTVPQTLERGGRYRIRRGTTSKLKTQSGLLKNFKGRRGVMKPRPYMRPALQKAVKSAALKEHFKLLRR